MMKFTQLDNKKIPETPILYYDAHNPNSYPLSGTTWFDLSGNGKNGTMVNGVIYSPENGGIMTFDGINDYVNLGNLALNYPFTISFWTKGYGTSTSGVYFSNPSDANSCILISIDTINNIIRCGYIPVGGGYTQCTSTGHTLSNFNLITGTFTSTGFNLYVNGEYKSTLNGAKSKVWSDTVNSYNINRLVRTTTSYTGGIINDVLIYNRVLTDVEIGNIYDAQKTKYNIPSKCPILDLDAGNYVSYPLTGTTWGDLSGYGNNGTLVNGATFSQARGGCIYFDGTNDYVTLGNKLGFESSDSFTINTWVNRRTTGTTDFILDKTNAGVRGYVLAFGSADSKLNLALRNTLNTNQLSIASDMAFTTGTWYNILITYNGSNQEIHMYINGFEITYTKLVDNLNGTILNDGEFRIGSRYNQAGTEFAGYIKEIQIFNRIITNQEISDLYNSKKDRYVVYPNGLQLNLDATNLNSYLPNSTLWKDISYSNYNGTLVSGVTYNGQSMVFNGVNGIVNLGNILNFERTNTFSISLWFKFNTYNGMILFDKYLSSSAKGYALVLAGTGTTYNLRFIIRQTLGTKELDVYSNQTISLNTWYNTTITYNGSNNANGLNVYLNGVNDSRIVTNLPLDGLISHTSSLWLGNRSSTPTSYNYLNGNINNVLVYNRVITQQEITDIYNNTRSKYGL